MIPVYTQYLATGGRAAFATMARAVAGASALTLCVVTLAGMLGARWIVTLMAPGWAADPPLLDLAVWLTRLMFPYLLLVGLAGLVVSAIYLIFIVWGCEGTDAGDPPADGSLGATLCDSPALSPEAEP